ncbi:MAG: DUF1360 domain-containing protein [Solirubrobacterales bacterium]|nr:DUF1360 domain-containing protein [Solirubrobacterales bacterium]
MTATAERVLHGAEEAMRSYAPGEERPLLDHAVLVGVYGTAVAGLSLLVRRRRRGIPERIPAQDLALLSVATHKLSRLLAKDTVTAPFRAPFTRFKGAGAPGEVNEEPRQDPPVRHAVGELVTCPFCMAQWVGTGFLFAYLLAPRATRAAASLFTMVAASDALQYAYTALGESVDG